MYVTPTIDAGDLHAILKEEFGCEVDLHLPSAAPPQASVAASAALTSPSRPAPRTGIITCHRHLLHAISSCILQRRKQISSISDPTAYESAAAVPPTLRLNAVRHALAALHFCNILRRFPQLTAASLCGVSECRRKSFGLHAAILPR
jgi:hypothetical protein